MIFSQLKENLERAGFSLSPSGDAANTYNILYNNIVWKYHLVVSPSLYELRLIETPLKAGEIMSIFFTRAVRDFKAGSLRLYFGGRPVVDVMY